MSAPLVPAILLLEDEPIILMDLEYAVEDLGLRPLCATSVGEALGLLETAQGLIAAVLDVSLARGQTCVPVAMELERMGVPFLLHSGDLNRADETVRRLGVRHITKPANADNVIAAAVGLAGSNAPETAPAA